MKLLYYLFLGGALPLGAQTIERSLPTKPQALPDSTAVLSHQLDAVTVQASQAQVRSEGGKLIFRLQQIPGLQGADLAEALRRLPGVQLHPQQGLVLHSLTPLVVLLDGRQIRLEGQELETYLQTIPLSTVSTVELIPNPSPIYGSGGRPVLNIRTKRHLEEGYQGYFSLRGTHQHHWGEQLQARLQLNKGISRSYLSYSLGEHRSRETTSFLGGQSSVAEVLPRRSQQLSLGSDLRVSPKHRLSATAQATWIHEDFQLREQLRTTLSRPGLYASLRHQYAGERLATGLAVEGSWGRLHQTYDLPAERPTSGERTAFFRLSPSLTYTLTPAVKLWGGLDYEWTDYGYRIESLGADYGLREHQLTPYLGLGASWGKLQLEGGLRSLFDRTALSGGGPAVRRTYHVLLPSLTVSYALGKMHQLTGEVRSSYASPDFRDLMPVVSSALLGWDRYGNGALTPSRSYTYALRYSLMQAAQLELSYSDTEAPVVEAPRRLSPGAIQFRKINLDHSRYLRALLVLPLPLARGKHFNWWVTTTGALQRQWDRGQVEGSPYVASFTGSYLNHRHDLTWGTWTLGLGITSYSALRFGLYQMERTWWTDASLAKRLGAWRLSASIRDPWNTNKARGRYTEGGLELSFVRNWHQPQFVLGLSYQFGKTQLKGYKEQKHRDATERMRSEANEGIARGVGQ